MKVQEYIYEEFQIQFLQGRAKGHIMINATEMAKAFGKETRDFLKNKSTKQFILALEQWGITHRSNSDIIDRRGHMGTYFCEELAMKLAAWLDPQFELWVYRKIIDMYLSDYREHQDSMTRVDDAEKEMQRIEDLYRNDPSVLAYKLASRNLAEAKNHKKRTTRQLGLFK